ncbi:MAG: hypothetical protein HYS07_00385 [Chlamydiae bacterium]|nr:hypothetical protein [Chlamydiota bacterium]MBI3278116.1 hypothetical protein [Chlamydiota bacterium]
MNKQLTIITALFFTSFSVFGDVELDLNPRSSSVKSTSFHDKNLSFYLSKLTSHPINNTNFLIDDFELDAYHNHLGGSSGTWQKDPLDSNEDCIDAIIFDDQGRPKSKVLRLQYDVESPQGGYNGFWTRLNGIDLTSFDKLKFWARGDIKEGFTKTFKIELKNSSYTSFVYVSGVTSKWKEFVIPLKNFQGILKVSKADEWVIVFEDRISNPKVGTLYFDDFTFEGSRQKFEEARKKAQDETNNELINLLTMDNTHLLNTLERKVFSYFLKETNSATGLIKDRSVPGAPASIASTGFGLIAYCIAEKNGWLTRVEAYQKILKILTTLEEADKEHGYFYHFLNPQNGKRWVNSEISSMDTALLMSGILFAGQYFPGTEISIKSSKLYAQVEWDWMLKNKAGLLYMEWSPEEGFEKSAVWNMSAEEMILYLLAMGSPTHPISSHAWSQWKREKFKEGEMEYISDPRCSLFTNLYTQALIDFRNTRVDLVNYWNNTRTAILANRDFCIQHKQDYKSYGEWFWGLSASDGPNGYQAYGAQEGAHDGTLAPYAMIASLPFAPEIVLPSLRHLLYEHGEQIWGPYGPTSAYNVDKEWYSKEYIGIDQGIMLLMIENFRTENVWKILKDESNIKRGIEKAGLIDSHSRRFATYDNLSMIGRT